MTCSLYANLSENNALGKKITQLKSDVAFVLKERVSALEIRIELYMDISTMRNVNYVYIPMFNRYYFVTDVHILQNAIYALQCRVDVLQSFYDEIKKLIVVLDKAQESNKSDLYIDDNSFVTENRMVNQIYNFPSGFNDSGEFILITVGG